MRLLIDFLPIVLFFIAFKWHGIYIATAVLMVATALQMLVTYVLDRRLQNMHKVTLAMVWIFGVLTLALHDERFIKWKPSVLYCALAIVLGVALWGMKRNLLKLLLASQLPLPQRVWHTLAVLWVAYCAFMAVSNAYVVLFYSTAAWVDFKLWGYIFPVLFIVGQGVYIAPYLKEEEPTPAHPVADDALPNTRNERHTLNAQEGPSKP